MLKFVIWSLIFMKNAFEKNYTEVFLAAMLLFLKLLDCIIAQIETFLMFFNNVVTL